MVERNDVAAPSVRERVGVLRKFERLAEGPMLLLALAWLLLMILEFTGGLNPVLQGVATVIWIVFIGEFLVRLVLAPKKLRFLSRNWLTVVALIIPALRVFRAVQAFRVLRLARASRGIQFVRVIGSLNRSMGALGRTMSRRGVGYVALLSLAVAFGGAAGMFFFERGNPGFESYQEALWWTSMILTTVGAPAGPLSGEGRTLAFLLALYGFSVFGYLAASLASFFVERDKEASQEEQRANVLVDEIRALRQALEESHRPA